MTDPVGKTRVGILRFASGFVEGAADVGRGTDYFTNNNFRKAADAFWRAVSAFDKVGAGISSKLASARACQATAHDLMTNGNLRDAEVLFNIGSGYAEEAGDIQLRETLLSYGNVVADRIASKQEGQTADQLLKQAYDLFRKGGYVEVVKVCEQAIRAQLPEGVSEKVRLLLIESHAALTRADMKSDNFEAALDHITRAREISEPLGRQEVLNGLRYLEIYVQFSYANYLKGKSTDGPVVREQFLRVQDLFTEAVARASGDGFETKDLEHIQRIEVILSSRRTLEDEKIAQIREMLDSLEPAQREKALQHLTEQYGTKFIGRGEIAIKVLDVIRPFRGRARGGFHVGK